MMLEPRPGNRLTIDPACASIHPMLLDRPFIQNQPESSALRHVVEPVVEFRPVGDQFVEHRVAIRMKCFHVGAVRDAGQEVGRDLRLFVMAHFAGETLR